MIIDITPCGECAYWDPRSWSARTRGYCIKMGSNHGDPDDPNSKAVAEDFESYRAYVITKADFGCIMGARPSTESIETEAP